MSSMSVDLFSQKPPPSSTDPVIQTKLGLHSEQVVERVITILETYVTQRLPPSNGSDPTASIRNRILQAHTYKNAKEAFASLTANEKRIYKVIFDRSVWILKSLENYPPGSLNTAAQNLKSVEKIDSFEASLLLESICLTLFRKPE